MGSFVDFLSFLVVRVTLASVSRCLKRLAVIAEVKLTYVPEVC